MVQNQYVYICHTCIGFQDMAAGFLPAFIAPTCDAKYCVSFRHGNREREHIINPQVVGHICKYFRPKKVVCFL